MNKDEILKRVYLMISRQSFADWYNDGGDFDNYIRAEENCPTKEEILKDLAGFLGLND